MAETNDSLMTSFELHSTNGLSASIKDAVVNAEANPIRADRTERELRQLLVLYIDQPNLKIITKHEIHSRAWRNCKISASRRVIRKSEVVQADKGLYIRSVWPSSELNPWPNEVRRLAHTRRLTLFQPSSLRLNAYSADWVDVDVDPRTLHFLLTIAGLKKRVGGTD